jgi:hypothetical protein
MLQFSRVGWLGIISFLVMINGCGAPDQQETTKKTSENKDTLTTVSRDTVPVQVTDPIPVVPEISTYKDTLFSKDYNSKGLTTAKEAFVWYSLSVNEYENWSEMYWGRCCTSADLQYSELMGFKISTNFEVKEYPFKNALSEYYKKPYVFKADENIEITIKFRKDVGYFDSNKALEPGNLVDAKDTILFPFRISFINGHVKSSELFEKNARVKTFELWHNGLHYCNVRVLDTPIPQVIETDFPFFKDDVIVLKPKTYFEGLAYDDVCISSFQTNLHYIIYSAFSEKYVYHEMGHY